MADMDIDMDLDLGMPEEYAVQEEAIAEADLAQPDTSKPILSTPNDTTISNALEPAPEKVHIRGLDNLTTADIEAFATENFPAAQRTRIEWIDDDSANITYESAEVASQALLAFAAIAAEDITNAASLQLLPAKKLSTQPNVSFQIRIAVLGDKKMAGARDRSRFYLWNPEYDTKEKGRRREGGNRYRERDDGGYRSRRYDDRENDKRGQVDINMGLDASMYDDDSSALAKRATRRTIREYSPRRDTRDGSRSYDRGRDRKDRDLFADQGTEKGRLRDRSASPTRENEWESKGDDTETLDRKRDMAAAANRQKAQLLKAKVRDEERSKELFPEKVESPSRHRRSDAFDAADGTGDLFSSRITSASGGVSRPLASRVTSRNPTMNGASSFSIRGAAKPLQAQSFSIKGAANGNARELFPGTLDRKGNAGKELFGRDDARNRKRQTAGDLFD